MTEEVDLKLISGFWRRVGALFIDVLILGLVGITLGLFLESTFVQIGVWGRLIGFTIALVYFGVMNSSVSSGQTIGKKVFGLRVVDSNNSPISLSKSAIRYFILAIPFFLNGANFFNEAILSYLMYPLSLIVFGGILSISYLYVFNRITRQSLHDLAIGTYVVNSNAEKQSIGNVWNVHLIVVVMLLSIAAIAPIFTTQLAQSESLKGVRIVQSVLSNNPNVNYARVSSGSLMFSSSNKGVRTTNYVSSQVFLKTNNVYDVDMARRLAFIVLAKYPNALQKDTIQITLAYGYDIGIASKWFKQPYNFNPRELMDMK